MDPFSITIALLGTALCAISSFLVALCLSAVHTLPVTQRLLARHLGGYRSLATSAAFLCLGWLLLLFTNLSLEWAPAVQVFGLALFVTALLIVRRPDSSRSQASLLSRRVLPVLIALSLALSPLLIFRRLYHHVSDIKWGLIR